MLTNCVPLMPTVQDKKHGIDVSNKIDSNTLLKNTKMQTNVISETLCSGSSVVEIDGTKVLCTVLGPIPALKNALNDTCIIECNLNSNAYIKDVLTSSESSISLSTNNTPPSSILESAMKPIICLHKYPKCIITINAVVLESGSGYGADSSGMTTSSEITASIAAATLALASSGIQMTDLVSCVTIACKQIEENYAYIANPTCYDIESACGCLTLVASNRNMKVANDVNITQLYTSGRLPVPQLLEMMQLGSAICSEVYLPLMKNTIYNPKQ